MANGRVLVAVCITLASPLLADGQASRPPDTVVVRNGSLTLRGLLFRPATREPAPAVLYSHGAGRNVNPKQAEILGPAFARHGYMLLYLHRRGSGLSADQGTNSAELMQLELKAKGQKARNELQLKLLEAELTDVSAGLAVLRQRPDVDTNRIIVVGHSFGGQLSLLLAERDPSIRATVVFGAAAASWEDSPALRARLLDSVRRNKSPVFFIHAQNDISIAPGKALSEAMAQLAKEQRLKIYPPMGTTSAEGHNFVHTGVSSWEPDVFGFLDEHIRR
jgi:carboxymethylenebutenolidase